MTVRRIPIVLSLFLMCVALGPVTTASPRGAAPSGENPVTFDRYHRPEELSSALQDLAGANPGFAKIHVLAKSPGGRDLTLLEVGPETAKTAKTLPAVFVAADMDGAVPLSGEAALYLAKLVCGRPTCDRTARGTSSPAAIRTPPDFTSPNPSVATAGMAVP